MKSHAKILHDNSKSNENMKIMLLLIEVKQ